MAEEIDVPVPDGREITEQRARRVKDLFETGYPDFHDYIAGGPVPPEEDRSYVPDDADTDTVELEGETLDWYRNLATAFGCGVGEAVSIAVFAENRAAVAGLLSRA